MGMPTCPFGCEPVKEALGRSIVPAVAFATHALFDVEHGKAVTEGVRRVLTAAIAVQDQVFRGTTMSDGHVEGFKHLICTHMPGHGPTDSLSRKQVDHHGQVESAPVGANVRHVRHPFLVWSSGASLSSGHKTSSK